MALGDIAIGVVVHAGGKAFHRIVELSGAMVEMSKIEPDQHVVRILPEEGLIARDGGAFIRS
jgi:hypothetical protein